MEPTWKDDPAFASGNERDAEIAKLAMRAKETGYRLTSERYRDGVPPGLSHFDDDDVDTISEAFLDGVRDGLTHAHIAAKE